MLPQGSLLHVCTVHPAFLLPLCLAGWARAGLLAPLYLCPPALPIPPLPNYWPFSFFLDQLGALYRQGETATPLHS